MLSEEITQYFVESKRITTKFIKDICTEIHLFYNEIEEIKENKILRKILNCLPIVDIKKDAENLKLNQTIISRNKMKCAFFGKTSNGKSAVINAILNRNLLPSSIGRTTSCFIKVEGCDDDNGFLMDKDGNKCDASQISNIANEFNNEKYEIDSIVSIFWPKNKCDLLKNDIEFLDSPGVDYSDEHKIWIKKYCNDADVFVYVIDACSTINESERMFFREVKSIVANPNIFILLNKWDICENEISGKRLEKVKRQHLSTVENFIRDDLKLNCDSEARTFFISAKEVLEESTSTQRNIRKKEFSRFVEMLQIEMSQNAIVNKSKPHLVKGLECLTKVLNSIETILDTKKIDEKMEENIDENFNENINDKINKLDVELRDLQKSRFDESREKLKENIDIEAQIFVFYIIENSNNLIKLDEKVTDLVRKIMEFLNRQLRTTTFAVLKEIKDKLTSFSHLNVSLNTLDDYFPSVPENSIDETLPSKGASNDESNETSNSSSSDVISMMSIVLSLNIELGLILNHRKMKKIEKKKLNSDYKEHTVNKLNRKINDVLIQLFCKLVDQRRDAIQRTTKILVDNFLKDHDEYCKFVESIEKLKCKCCSIEEDIKQEMDKIDRYENG